MQLDEPSKIVKPVTIRAETDSYQVTAIEKGDQQTPLQDDRRQFTEKKPARVPKTQYILRLKVRDHTSRLKPKNKGRNQRSATQQLGAETDAAAEKLRQELKKKESELSNERLESARKDLEINLLRDDNYKVRQDLEKSRESIEGLLAACNETATIMQSCRETVTVTSLEMPNGTSNKRKRDDFTAVGFENQGRETIVDDIESRTRPKAGDATRSDPVQQTSRGTTRSKNKFQPERGLRVRRNSRGQFTNDRLKTSV